MALCVGVDRFDDLPLLGGKYGSYCHTALARRRNLLGPGRKLREFALDLPTDLGMPGPLLGGCVVHDAPARLGVFVSHKSAPGAKFQRSHHDAPVALPAPGPSPILGGRIEEVEDTSQKGGFWHAAAA